MNLASIHDGAKLKAHGLCVKPETLRIWKHYGKFVSDGLFLKIGNRLYVDLDVWEQILRKEQKRMIEQGKKMAEAKSFRRKV